MKNNLKDFICFSGFHADSDYEGILCHKKKASLSFEVEVSCQQMSGANGSDPALAWLPLGRGTLSALS